MSKQTPPQVSPPAAELAELQAFAKLHGRKWKDVLNARYWYRGEPVDGFPLLYGLRNHPDFGPEWLHHFKLPREKSEATPK